MPRRRTVWTVASGCALLLVLLVVTIPPTGAVDTVAVFTPDPDRVEVAPGETVVVDVWLHSGDEYGEGAAAVTFAARYDPAYVEVVDVEPRPWLEGDGATAHTEIDDGTPGVLVVEQRRDPPGDGVSGQDVFVTLTLRATEEAAGATTPIAFHESEVVLTNDWPQPVFAQNVTVVVDEEPSAPDDGVSSPSATVLASAVVVAALALALGARRRRRLR